MLEQYVDSLLDTESAERRKKLVECALPKNLERIRSGLETYGIQYNVWFSEKSLYDSGELELMRKLAEFPDEIRISAQTLEPSRLTRYVTDVASLFHSFYNACRVKGEEEGLMKARLFLVAATRIVIKNVLDIISIGAPERM